MAVYFLYCLRGKRKMGGCGVRDISNPGRKGENFHMCSAGRKGDRDVSEK